MGADQVHVSVGARLHLGFLDLHGGLGRRFGSLGIALDGPCTRLSVTRVPEPSASGPDAARAQACVERMVAAFGLSGGFRVEVETTIPAHAGLGSGTQLALAVGAAVGRLAGLELDARDVARVLDRGARSGIGIGAFEQGGVLLDGGRGADDEPPPVLARFAFPEDWRVLLAFDRRRQGAHGADETEAFAALPEFPADRAADLCRLVLMSALPALCARDLGRFGAAVTEMQRTVGDHFAPVQGGRFASPEVAEVLAWLEAEGVPGVGQSSWGPTGFGLVASPEAAERLRAAASRRWPETTGLHFEVRSGSNHGATVETVEAPRRLVAKP